jgi:hypothetical protein
VTLFNLGVMSIGLYRQWARLALIPYIVAALIALRLRRRDHAERYRLILAAAVFVGAAALPLALEVWWRGVGVPVTHAQPEVFVLEQAARALLHGHNPYATLPVRGPLGSLPLGERTHFPYLPAMLIFGLPHALDGRSLLTDARIYLAMATVLIALLALRLAKGGERNTTAFLVLAALPTGALAMVTGGDDLPVLALMLLALVLASRRRPALAGVVAGLAAAMKQTAWPLLPFLVVTARHADGTKAKRTVLVAIAAVTVPLLAPFGLWNPGGFMENIVRFPLGLGQAPTTAQGDTFGALLVRSVPSEERTVVTILLVGVVLVIGSVLLLALPKDGASAAARGAGWAFVVALLLAPADRAGYFMYPIDLLVWGWLLRDGSRVPSGHGDQTEEVVGSSAVPIPPEA